MNSDAAQMLLAVRIGLRAATHSFKRSQAGVGARRFRASEGAALGQIMLKDSGGLPPGATLESAETPRTPAQGGAAAESYAPPLVDGERWPRAARRLRACRGPGHVGARPCGARRRSAAGVADRAAYRHA